MLGNHDHEGNASAQIAYSSLSSRWNMPSLYYDWSASVGTTGAQTAHFVLLDVRLLVGECDAVDDRTAVRKLPFMSHFLNTNINKMIHLPSRARDKHRKSLMARHVSAGRAHTWRRAVGVADWRVGEGGSSRLPNRGGALSAVVGLSERMRAAAGTARAAARGAPRHALPVWPRSLLAAHTASSFAAIRWVRGERRWIIIIIIRCDC